jgi:hypothetical protein
MLKWILFWSFILSSINNYAQVDSLLVAITLLADNDKVERSQGYWQARKAVDVKMDMYGFVGGKHLAHSFTLKYDIEKDAWLGNVPKGYYELRIESLGFTNIKFPFRLKKDHQEEFRLKLDSVAYTYKHKKRYNYIAGTLNFCETIVVQFRQGEFADNRTFLMEALALEGLEHLEVLRTQKIRHTNAFLVTLGIADRTPLNILLYNKMTNKSELERGYWIGPDVTKAIEVFQENDNVLSANPSFLDDPNAKFRTSAKYTQTEQLERKLLRLMEEDVRTLDKINYIIDKTTVEEPKKEDIK